MRASWERCSRGITAACGGSDTPVSTFGKDPIPAGEKTVADCWQLLPYENGLVVAELTPAQLVTIVSEDRGKRLLWPFELELSPSGETKKFLFQGQPVDPVRRFRIGFNTYDGQSGGQTLMRLNEILMQPESRRREVPVSTRQALIDYLSDKGEI